MPSNNIVVISAAGSRKTTYIVEEVLAHPNKKALILTYTIDNLEQIKQYFIERNGAIPSNVRVQSWYSFLLQECARPYQNALYDKKRIETICFVQGKSAQYIKKTDIDKYYFANSNRIYTDKISDFACECDEKSGGLVINRLENIYDSIFIDEVQDLAGYDFEFLERLFNSRINVTVVGDNRQATYVTNYSPKNAQFKGKNIIELFKLWETKGLCSIQERNECYRCNQVICDFADALYPDMPKTVSKQNIVTNHEGLFIIRKKDVEAYIQTYSPRLLRYMISKETAHLNALNFGLSKGQSFDRVLIFPTKPIKEYLTDGDLKKIGDKSKFYVALTRARYSVAFIHDDECFSEQVQQFQPKNLG
jgi:DNA helicase II / ATP-dependent DNA helicase PcrA